MITPRHPLAVAALYEAVKIIEEYFGHPCVDCRAAFIIASERIRELADAPDPLEEAREALLDFEPFLPPSRVDLDHRWQRLRRALGLEASKP